MDEELRQQIVDDEQIRLLRIGYFICGGVSAFTAIAILGYSLFFAYIFSQITRQGGAGAPPAFIGRMIGGLFLVFALCVLAIAVLQIVTGLRLQQRRSRVLCLIIAALTCLGIPYGTFLGVCTFIVLSRNSVQKTFHPPQVETS